MTKKHLAADLRDDYRLVQTDRERMIFEHVMASLCNALASTNPNFDRNKFLDVVYGE